jgi:hypothetical protein
MAIHEFDYINDEKLGYFKFLEWSKTGGISFKGEGDVKTTWGSIKVSANGIGIVANAEPRGSAPIVLDSSLAYRLTTSGSRFKSALGSLTLNSVSCI